MSSNIPLLRMMFLVTFLIFILIAVSRHFDKRRYDPSDPYYKRTIFLKKQNRAFSVLKHTISQHYNFLYAYSVKYDSIMSFPLKIQSDKMKNDFRRIVSHDNRCGRCHN